MDPHDEASSVAPMARLQYDEPAVSMPRKTKKRNYSFAVVEDTDAIDVPKAGRQFQRQDFERKSRQFDVLA